MRVVIPGGSGQVGAILARDFHRSGHEVVVLARQPAASEWRTVVWDGVALGDWVQEIDGAGVVINLAGRNVNCRYGARNREQILQSRVQTTRLVGEAIAAVDRPPPVWLQASTATIYAHRFDAANDEAHGIPGGDEAGIPDTWKFSVEVAKAWERAFDQAEMPGTRKVAMRSAMTMSPDRGGVFDTLLTLVRRGLGGRAGNGQQYVSWIHDQDFIAAVRHILADDSIRGVVNLAAPHPLPNADFMRALRAAAGVRMGLPATKWMLELGAIFMRTETELVLKSRRVIPGVLAATGFQFTFPTWPEAAVDLYRRWQAGLSQS